MRIGLIRCLDFGFLGRVDILVFYDLFIVFVVVGMG